MNTEEFLYLDLILTLILSIYSFVITRNIAPPQYNYESVVITSPSTQNSSYPYMPHGIKFYIYGNLIINVLFFWYFSYCRYLNGKDVITLRRSIQLLSHSFQLSSVGLLALCHERSNNISHSENAGCLEENACNAPYTSSTIYGEVTFICTPEIWSTYSLRVVLNSAILFKTLVDEYLCNFVISRGTMIDLAMVLFIPIGSIFSYLTDYHADNFMKDMRRILSVTYETNDISQVQVNGYYSRLIESHHSKEVNVLMFAILMTGNLFLVNYTFLVTLLMSEYFVCGQNKLGTLVLVLVVTICISFYSGIGQLIVAREGLLILVLFLVIYQNRRHVSLTIVALEVVKALFLLIYTVVYCPLHPLITFFVAVGESKDISFKSSTAASETSVKRIDEGGEGNYQEKISRSICLNVICVPFLILVSPVIKYHWEDVEVDLQLSLPSLKFLAEPYLSLQKSNHKPQYSVTIWMQALVTMTFFGALIHYNSLRRRWHITHPRRVYIILSVSLGLYLYLVVENFIFKQNNFGSMFVTLTLTLSLLLTVQVNLSTGFLTFFSLFILNAVLLVLVVYQNKAKFHWKQLPKIGFECFLFWYYTLLVVPYRIVLIIFGKNKDSLSSAGNSISNIDSSI